MRFETYKTIGEVTESKEYEGNPSEIILLLQYEKETESKKEEQK